MIRVIIAEDMRLLRDSLVRLLSFTSDITVVAEFERGEHAVADAPRHRPDVAVLDVRLPDINGFEVARRLQNPLPRCRTLFMTSYATPANLRQAAAVGAYGFIAKDRSADALAEAVRSVHAGRKVFDPDVVADALTHTASPLTPREVEVLRLAARGEPPGAIARSLSLAAGTVRNHLAACTTKLGARNRADAFRIATENGWL
ncbi:response regulator transcription factor [Nocardiopsis valliformis]|uniref:response regulator transcription factor n=1 Tax=Nocardiopsis valliformis TaxID=239974 RepID=UPI00034D2BBC|nr:response regulator transcription factor [Nocardiopsis valliformis]